MGSVIPPAPSPIFQHDTATELLNELDLDHDYLRYTEEDLSGAIYHYDNDPHAPTAKLVADFSALAQRLGNMGVSD
jgi:hypothetical protein